MRSRESGDAAFLDDVREACATIVARLEHRRFPDLVENAEFQDGIVLQLHHFVKCCPWQIRVRTRRAIPTRLIINRSRPDAVQTDQYISVLQHTR